MPLSTLVPPLITGAAFGAALLASSVYLPSVILSQLRLQSTHMLKSFLTASSVSAIIIYIYNRLANGTKLPHRTNSGYGWFGAYDANLVGGVLQGLGMALTGACPGTVLVQVALGYESARYVALGGVIGGAAFVALGDRLRRARSVGGAGRKHTVMQRFNVSEETAVVGYEVMLLAMIAGVGSLGISSRSDARFWITAVQGGLLIGMAQALSVLLAKKTLGVSSAYGELAGQLSSLVRGKGGSGSWCNVVFALGVMAGARLASGYVPVIEEESVDVGVALALFGGFVSIFGARMAGGCTSGHGISGMSTLSVSSFVTVAGMFGGGIACRLILDAI